MAITAFLTQLHTSVGRLSVHQDFFWFFSLLIWSLTLIAWWRLARRGADWFWLPWCAGAAVATAVIQFGMFNPTFDIFQDRLVPGTLDTYRPALVDPYWLGDVLMAAVMATMTAGWGWMILRRIGWQRLSWVPVAFQVVVVWIHVASPAPGGEWLAGLALGSALALVPFLSSAQARIAAVGAGLVPTFSTIGPVAEALGHIQRFGPPSPTGLGAAAFQLLLGAAIFLHLLRSHLHSQTKEARQSLWRELRPFVLGGVGLLVTGMLFGIITGRDNRNEILQNRLRTAAAQALVFEPELLEPLGAPQFHVEFGAAPAQPGLAHSTWLATGVAEPARRRLAEVVLATPFVQTTRILVIREGWLVVALVSDRGTPAGTLEVLRRATPRDLEAWDHTQPYIEESPVPEIGYHYYCRAPIVGHEGRMLGWLDCVRDEYYLSVERRWRAGPFLITDLGLVLLGLVFIQRRVARERAAALHAMALAAESNRIKTTFLANVSHELRTPLQNILGYGELLQQDVTGETGAARLGALRQQGELMTRLVNDLIDLSAVETGSFQLSPRTVEISAVLRQTVEGLRPRAEHKGLKLELGFSATAVGWFEVDDTRFRQVALNLVGNAIKFTDQGTVGVFLHCDRSTTGNAQLILSVRDTGPGIAPDQQSKLFTPFSRLAQTADREGSGLGLALSAALCRAMSGDITLESDGKAGCCFTATMQAALATAPQLVRPRYETKPGAGPRVLVVDDNQLVRELFVAALTERGASCHAASSGTAALACLAEDIPDVIILDLALPDGDGTDYLARIRKLGAGIRIIGVSAHAGAADRSRALAAGMDAFLVKPVLLDALWDAVVCGAVTSQPKATFFDIPETLRAQLRTEFLRELPAKRAKLEAAVRAEDWEFVRAEAHHLMNSALVLNDDLLFTACSGLEQAAEAGDAVAAQNWWRRCAEALALV